MSAFELEVRCNRSGSDDFEPLVDMDMVLDLARFTHMNKNTRKCAMRMLDADREQSVRVLQLYVTVREATELQQGLTELLRDPEKSDHVHVFAKDMSSELSISIVTEKKLNSGDCTALEYGLFSD